ETQRPSRPATLQVIIVDQHHRDVARGRVVRGNDAQGRLFGPGFHRLVQPEGIEFLDDGEGEHHRRRQPQANAGMAVEAGPQLPDDCAQAPEHVAPDWKTPGRSPALPSDARNAFELAQIRRVTLSTARTTRLTTSSVSSRVITSGGANPRMSPWGMERTITPSS